MKIITPPQISSVVRTVVDCAETKSAHLSLAEGGSYLTSALESMATSARAGLGLSKLTTKAEVLKSHPKVMTSGTREFIENCSEGSAELEAIHDILSMIEGRKNGIKFDEDILRGFTGEAKISENIVSDLQKMKEYRLHIQSYIPVLSSKKEALKQMDVGDVFQIFGDEVVSIKNRKGEIEALKMSKQNYELLFPPVLRFSNYQSDFGNCYEVTALNSVMSRAETRENILRCIDTESEKGIVKIKFPNSSFDEPIRIGLLDMDAPEYYTQGCRGLQYIEHALGKEYEHDFIIYQLGRLKEKGNTSKMVNVEQAYHNGDSRYLARRFGADNGQSLGTNLRDGGFAILPWYKLGFGKGGSAYIREFKAVGDKNAKEYMDYTWADKYMPQHYTEDEDSFLELLWDPEFFRTHLVETATADMRSASGLTKQHSYSMSAVLDKNGKVSSYMLKNPHGIVEREYSIDDIVKAVDSITFSKID